MFLIYLWFQPPNCSNRKRFRREDQTIEDESPATIEVYSGLYVNEGVDSGNPEQMDQVAREKVCFIVFTV